jgi:hypothetical protein
MSRCVLRVGCPERHTEFAEKGLTRTDSQRCTDEEDFSKKVFLEKLSRSMYSQRTPRYALLIRGQSLTTQTYFSRFHLQLEQFLIANREEYLRHSALNYTVQQKQYNNRLTSRLLELASENGYVFDEREFSFVTVRDRIRCYFKSYVQSAKKRGILMGYAARKAGLLSSDDLESNTSGSIVTPATSL